MITDRLIEENTELRANERHYCQQLAVERSHRALVTMDERETSRFERFTVLENNAKRGTSLENAEELYCGADRSAVSGVLN